MATKLVHEARGSLWVQLGRLGDIINILPLVQQDTRFGIKPSLLVAREYASLLEGVSYCDPVIWEGNFADLDGAIASARGKFREVNITQVYGQGMTMMRSTDSFAKESWRRVNRLHDFGTLPLLFDLRNATREAALVHQFTSQKPIILVAPKGLSSPFEHGDRMMRLIRDKFSKNCHVIDLSLVKAHRFYDFLGLYDAARCLVSIDTGHLHLARGSKVPVVALATDRPTAWHGCPLFEGQRLRVTYGEYERRESDIVSAIESCLAHEPVRVKTASLSAQARKIFHVYSDYSRDGGSKVRHDSARSTWRTEYAKASWVECPVTMSDVKRNSRLMISDTRDLPFIKDMIDVAEKQASPNDIIVISNDDILFSSDLTAELLNVNGKRGAWANRWDFNSIPRTFNREEIKRGRWCCGTDLFAFTASWWKVYKNIYPDMILGCEAWDWVMRELISDNGGFEIHAAIYHQFHPSFWQAGNNRRNNPGNRHNQQLAIRWLECRRKDLAELKGVA